MVSIQDLIYIRGSGQKYEKFRINNNQWDNYLWISQ